MPLLEQYRPHKELEKMLKLSETKELLHQPKEFQKDILMIVEVELEERIFFVI